MILLLRINNGKETLCCSPDISALGATVIRTPEDLLPAVAKCCLSTGSVKDKMFEVFSYTKISSKISIDALILSVAIGEAQNTLVYSGCVKMFISNVKQHGFAFLNAIQKKVEVSPQLQQEVPQQQEVPHQVSPQILQQAEENLFTPQNEIEEDMSLQLREDLEESLHHHEHLNLNDNIMSLSDLEDEPDTCKRRKLSEDRSSPLNILDSLEPLNTPLFDNLPLDPPFPKKKMTKRKKSVTSQQCPFCAIRRGSGAVCNICLKLFFPDLIFYIDNIKYRVCSFDTCTKQVELKDPNENVVLRAIDTISTPWDVDIINTLEQYAKQGKILVGF